MLRSQRGVILKSVHEIEMMREAGRLVYQILQRLKMIVQPGVTSAQLNEEAEKMIVAVGATPLFKGVEAPKVKYPFPAVLCTSVNEEVVHGIPNDRKLANGEIISIDCGVRLRNFCGDSAVTLAVGSISPETQKLLDVTQHMLQLAIQFMAPGVRWSEIAKRMQKYAEGHGFSVVREFVGHGIGREMHEDPKVPNYYDRQQAKFDFVLKPGMVLAVEPMVNAGRAEVEYKDQDFWAVVTKDRQWSAHFEHTIAVTERGCDVLTDGR